MKLTSVERVMITNQLLILERLYPEESALYASQRKALEQGYTLHYGDLTAGFYDEVSEERCQEIIDILQMYRVITNALNTDECSDLAEHTRAKFEGFDGSEETSELLYTQYFILDLNRYKELKYGSEHPDWEAHRPMLGVYRRMLQAWIELGRPWTLDRNQLSVVLDS